MPGEIEVYGNRIVVRTFDELSVGEKFAVGIKMGWLYLNSGDMRVANEVLTDVVSLCAEGVSPSTVEKLPVSTLAQMFEVIFEDA